MGDDPEWKFVQYDTKLNLPGDSAAGYEVTSSIVDAVQRQGFCVIDCKAAIEALAEGGNLYKEADGEVAGLEESGRFEQPAEQLVRGLLGEDGSAAVCEINTGLSGEDGEGMDGPNLQKLDSVLTSLMWLVQPVAEDQLGLNFGGRSSGLLHLGGQVDDDDGEAPQLTPAEADKWLSFFVNQRLMLLLFIGPGKGHLELKPFKHEDAELFVVSTEAGTGVILRSDTLAHRFYSYGRSVVLTTFLQQTLLDEHVQDPGQEEELLLPEAKALMTWMGDKLRTLKETEKFTNDGPQYEMELTDEWRSTMNHMYTRGVPTAVRGMAAKFPATWDPYNSWATFCSGADMASEVPMMRWKHEDHYNPDVDAWKMFKTYSKHGTFIDGAELFDPKPFGLAVYEAKGMDPCQRHILETSYECLLDAKWTKKQLMRSLIGVYIGSAQTEFINAENCNEGVGTSCAGAITSNRISFCLGMQGPSYTIDCGGAASLVALSTALNSLKYQSDLIKVNTAGVAGAINLMLAPQYFILGCAAGYLSSVGRTLSFDVSAAGYSRGEGCGAVVMNQLGEIVNGELVRDETRPYHGNVSAAFMAHGGSSACLSAPNGSQESSVVANCVRVAGLSPFDIDAAEVWGEGGILSDAVAVKATLNGLRPEESTQPILISSVLSNIGFCHESMGMAQLWKALFTFKNQSFAPGIHLNELNPHMDVWEGEPANFLTECTQTARLSSYVSLTAKSNAGCLVNAILWGQVDPVTYVPRKRLKGDLIAFWPSGGGELPDGAEPLRGYYIVGSWASSQWAEGGKMEAEGDGVYGFTVTMGVNRFEHFQILLDGLDDRVLHPGMPQGQKNMPVQGPDGPAESEGLAWAIDVREQYATFGAGAAALTDGGEAAAGEAPAEAAEGLPGQLQVYPYHRAGSAGDKYRVRLRVAGKWRTVDWQLEEAAPAGKAFLDNGSYYLAAEWNDWNFDAMKKDDTTEGVYHKEVTLTHWAADFQVVRNKDWHQTFFPTGPVAASGGASSSVEGPDANVEGAYWRLKGRPGEVYRVTFRRALADGKESLELSWSKVE